MEIRRSRRSHPSSTSFWTAYLYDRDAFFVDELLRARRATPIASRREWTPRASFPFAALQRSGCAPSGSRLGAGDPDGDWAVSDVFTPGSSTGADGPRAGWASEAGSTAPTSKRSHGSGRLSSSSPRKHAGVSGPSGSYCDTSSGSIRKIASSIPAIRARCSSRTSHSPEGDCTVTAHALARAPYPSDNEANDSPGRGARSRSLGAANGVADAGKTDSAGAHREWASTRPSSSRHPPGDDRLFVLEQDGVVRVIDGETNLRVPRHSRPCRVPSANEQGLLGIAFPPDYASSGAFYLYYTADDLFGDSRLARYRVSANPNVARTGREGAPRGRPAAHQSQRGDRSPSDPTGCSTSASADSGGAAATRTTRRRTAARSSGSCCASTSASAISDDDLTIPASNPFFGDEDPGGPEPNLRCSTRSGHWALRNPYRFSFDRATGDLYIADVGQNAFEEINVELAPDPDEPIPPESRVEPTTAGTSSRRTLVGWPPATRSAKTRGFTPPVHEYPHPDVPGLLSRHRSPAGSSTAAHAPTSRASTSSPTSAPTRSGAFPGSAAARSRERRERVDGSPRARPGSPRGPHGDLRGCRRRDAAPLEERGPLPRRARARPRPAAGRERARARRPGSASAEQEIEEALGQGTADPAANGISR